MARLRMVWWRLRGSLWFVPSVLVVLATALAFGLVWVDEVADWELQRRWPRIFGVGAEGARSLLSAIATAMLTVAGTMFSVTLAVLSLAASQYSPRVLRTFISDRPTQVVLGFFVAVFAYCLVVLRTIRAGEASFVPSLAVLGGIVLAFAAVALLVYFIHHLAASIQASSILARVTAGTAQAIQDLFPEELGTGAEEEEAPDAAANEGAWSAVPARASGYIVSLDDDALLDFARRTKRVVRMDLAIGDFAVAGQALASLQGGQPIDEEASRTLNACYELDQQRTIEQDAAFGLQQIADIALKALSPGINDQSTAVLCIDRMSELLVLLARRRVAPRRRSDGETLRVLARGPGFGDLVAIAFNDPCTNAAGKPAVLGRLLEALRRVSRETDNRCRRTVLREAAGRVAECAERSVRSAADRKALLESAAALDARLRSGVASRDAA